VFENVPVEYLPPPEHRPTLCFGDPRLHYAWTRGRLNAAEEILACGLRRAGAERVAIIHSLADGTREEWTYGRLAAMVNRFAGGLREVGVRPGDRVLTRFSETPEAAIAQLAVWWVGALVVPCVTAESARELGFVLRDTEARAAICETSSGEALLEALAGVDIEPVVIGSPAPLDGHRHSVRSLAEGQPDSVPAHPTAPFDASGIYYTGGTTGQPKGCLHTHVAEVALADLNLAARGIGPDDVLLTHAPIGHAFGNGEKINFPLRAGARAVYRDRPTPDVMWDLVVEEQVTMIVGAATMYRLMLQAGGRAAGRLRGAVSSGEVLDVATARRFELQTGVPLRNTVGMTPVRHLFLESARDGRNVAPLGSVGAPLPGYEARLIDPDGAPATTPGEPGRLALRGPSGITYWLNAHEGLRERAAQDVRGGWSVLDDAYTRDDEGWLWFSGRLDDMIVTAGRQVSPIEVEQVLSGHAAVAEVAVIPLPDPVRGTVVSAVVRAAEAVRDEAELTRVLQDFAKAKMAAYKYPREIRFVDELPKDGVGKIQRRRLREAFAPEAAQPAEPPAAR
jgi:2-aminobenzoate-CoA ligase